jgi:MoaA/NifB/PqqE/SkfB family radical SAM enzyme
MVFDKLEPTSFQSFQIAWESTLLCNLNCSYCGDGHDNTTRHPDIESSLKTVDFIFEYTDIQMSKKPKNQQMANLNIQGGESLFHPDIDKILKYAVSKKKLYEWYMGIAFITNAVVGPALWKKLSKYIDYYTISYHAESLPKQQQLVKNNILFLVKNHKNFHVSIMMHPKHWDNCLDMIEWCKNNNVKHNIRQIDHHWMDIRFNYNSEQSRYLTGSTFSDKFLKILTGKVDLSSQGRSCCGGNTLCASGCETTRVVNKFKGWHCSVDKFFLYIRQHTGEVFTNKDCRMNFNGSVGPIGNLNNTKAILDTIKAGTDTIICKKNSCWCGLCAPKAKHADDYAQLMNKYATTASSTDSSH